MGWNPLRKKDYVSIATVTALLGCGDIPGLTPDAGNGGAVEAKFSSLYSHYLQQCSQCHAPGAPGRPSDIEQTLDFSTQAKAFQTVTTGNAAGLQGNFSACNTVPFVVSGHPETSLLVASLDQPTRQSYVAPGVADCNSDAVADMTVKLGVAPSDEFIGALKTWISNGAQNN